MSRVLVNPWMMLNPDTLAVMEPIVAAANAVVDKWPSETTDASCRLYSRICVLYDEYY